MKQLNLLDQYNYTKDRVVELSAQELAEQIFIRKQQELQRKIKFAILIKMAILTLIFNFI